MPGPAHGRDERPSGPQCLWQASPCTTHATGFRSLGFRGLRFKGLGFIGFRDSVWPIRHHEKRRDRDLLTRGRQRDSSILGALGFKGFRVYLNPEEPTFLGFVIMISLYKSLKR